MMTHGKRLKWLRNIYDLTQTELADVVHVSRAHLAGIEAEHKEVSDKIAVLLEKAYGVSESWVLSGEGLMFSDYRMGVNILRDTGLGTTDGLYFLCNLCHQAWSFAQAAEMDTRSQYVLDMTNMIHYMIGSNNNIPELTVAWDELHLPNDLPLNIEGVQTACHQSATVPCTWAAATVSAIIDIIRNKLVNFADSDVNAITKKIAQDYPWIYDVSMVAAAKREVVLSSVELPLEQIRALNPGDRVEIDYRNELIQIHGKTNQDLFFSGILHIKDKATLRINVCDLVEMLAGKHVFSDDRSNVITLDHERTSTYLTPAEYQSFLALATQITASETYGSLLWLHIQSCGYI